MTTGPCRDGMLKDGAGSTDEGAADDCRDLTISVFLRGGFLRALEGHDYGAGQGTLAASVEGCVRSLYPSASVSVRTAELLDDDWEVEIGELGRGRMSGDDRAGIEMHLRSAVGAAVSRFRAAD